ncbi:hypothetical protein [Herbaspirillum huttiense]|uniref:hypothetical protein n=1 Tax=Herbaspirillum huttiense TaxID=863372 RepID=UPI002176EDF6|nr:hypothetical protein [Herbaspirillum huttiense]UWE15656.1 hypothetical protein NY669_21625 [Herbaspirillum huttiense]
MPKCTKCNSEDWSVVEKIGALETWRCGACGNEETVHVFDPLNEPLLPPNLEPVFQIVGRWISKPSPQQISEIQGTFPVLRKVPASALLRKSMEQSDIELGRFTESEMNNLEHVLLRLGMQVTRTPISLGNRK